MSLEVYQKHCLKIKAQLRHGDTDRITDTIQSANTFNFKVTENIVRRILESGYHKNEQLLEQVFEVAKQLLRTDAQVSIDTANRFDRGKAIEIQINEEEKANKADKRKRLEEQEDLINM